MERLNFGLLAAHVAPAGSSVVLAIAVQYFLPKSTGRDSEPIRLPGHGGEVKDGENRVFWRFPLTQQRKHAGGAIVTIHPFKSRRVAVENMHSGFTLVHAV